MKLLERFTKPANQDWFVHLLGSWKLWILGALIGAIAGFGVKQIFPGEYFAEATVMIDHNVEQVIPIGRDSDLFLYLARETRKLEALALSDDVLGYHVTEVGPGFSLEELRTEYLDLTPPGDGEWHFVARHSNADMAEMLAVAWVNSFEKVLMDSTEVSLELEELRAGLMLEAEKEVPDWELIQPYLDKMFAIMEDTSGVSPYLEYDISKVDGVQALPVVSNAMALLIGSIFGFAAAFLARLIKLTGEGS